MSQPIVVTIDGPAGAGKSSVARALADRLGFRFLDTGAMYRAAALAIVQRGWAQLAPAEQVERVSQLQIDIQPDRVLLDGADVTEAIREPVVTEATHLAADHPGIRATLVGWQRQFASGGDTVSEGRDQGTVVFPDALCKIYLTASIEERARRRHEELLKSGQTADWSVLLQQIRQRDERDRARPVGPLVRAPDAVSVSTDGLGFDEVVERLLQAVRQCRGES